MVGSVEHWEHIHTRTNRYKAKFSIEPENGQWRITRFWVLRREQLHSELRVR